LLNSETISFMSSGPRKDQTPSVAIVKKRLFLSKLTILTSGSLVTPI
jgi:hypothetical protein